MLRSSQFCCAALVGVEAFSFLRQEPGGGSGGAATLAGSSTLVGGSGSQAGSRGDLAREEDHIKVKETPPGKSFLGHCYDMVASVVVLNDGDPHKIETMLGTVCAQADLNADASLCSDIKQSFLRQIAHKDEFREENKRPLGERHYGAEQQWNEDEFDAHTFCQSALDIIIANRMQVGPAKPAGVLNTPVDPEAAKAAHEAYMKGELPGSGSASSAPASSAPAP